MFLITGDTHGEAARFTPALLPGEEKLTKEDYVIVCGDFGFVFLDNEEERRKLDELAKKPYTILFVDGNHENFPALYAFPEEMWMGGRTHRIRPNIRHLMRGQVFTIEGRRFFTFGGGHSIDWRHRTPGMSWWPEEMPSEAEREEGRRNLAACGYRVDYILTHAAPEMTMCRFHPFHAEEAPLNFFLEYDVRAKTEYVHWYFGHLHEDRDVGMGQTALWFDVRELESGRSVCE